MKAACGFLDTNHLRECTADNALGARLRDRLLARRAELVTTLVCVEEGFRGWLSKLNATQEPAKQVWLYARLDSLVHTLGQFIRRPWDIEAATRFQQFRAQGLRTGALDLRIACITLEYDATLLTRNTSDFAKVPGLRFENWLD